MEKKKRMHTLTQLSVINSHARERVFHKNNTTERATLQLLAGGWPTTESALVKSTTSVLPVKQRERERSRETTCLPPTLSLSLHSPYPISQTALLVHWPCRLAFWQFTVMCSIQAGDSCTHYLWKIQKKHQGEKMKWIVANQTLVHIKYKFPKWLISCILTPCLPLSTPNPCNEWPLYLAACVNSHTHTHTRRKAKERK